MSEPIDNPRERLRSFHERFEQPDPLTHEQAKQLLPALVAAEQAGEDVDSDPRFADLLLHLEKNALSLDLYEALSSVADQPSAAASAPQFFTVPRQQYHLRVSIPSYNVNSATLSSGRRVTVFTGPLPAQPTAPQLILSLFVGDDPYLEILALDDEPGMRWQVEIQIGPRSFRLQTNPAGEATLTGLALADLAPGTSIEIRLSSHDQQL